MERVPATALSGRPRNATSGDGHRFRSELHGEAIPNAEAVVPAFFCGHARDFFSLVPHGSTGLCPDAAGEPGETAMEIWVQSSSTDLQRVHRMGVNWINAGYCSVCTIDNPRISLTRAESS